MKLTQEDRATLERRGITEDKFNEQVRRLKAGFPYLQVESAATPRRGIMVLDREQRHRYEQCWDEYLSHGAKVVKMVPASGAASRMFKNLFKFAEGDSAVPDTDFVREFCEGVHQFAFFPELDAACERIYGMGVNGLFASGRHRDVVKALLLPAGMNYGSLPKGLLLFHEGEEGSRTALEEHLAEAAQYASGADRTAHLHFTVSPEHIGLFKNRLEHVLPVFEAKYGVKYHVDLSVQKPSTDTVALGPDGEPFRVDGELFFRPGGHGALIENLAEIDADVVFLKNIDNVVPDSKRAVTVEYKKVLGGVLVHTRNIMEKFVFELESGLPSRPELNEMLDFCHEVLSITGEGAESMDDLELADYLLCKFSRPLRVCGMVRNEGEPGGGPYLVRGMDGTVAPQILESTQIDMSKQEGRDLVGHATHFNPVDLVCSLKDFEGAGFDLSEFVDPDTGFISEKSVKGVDIKALELPGLWNGAMSDWNTIFVEVPEATFNPVKTVNDLLRAAHQADAR